MTREEKMNKRREAGKGYTYQPNPYEKGTREYRREKNKRARKNVGHKTECQKLTSMFAKLDNDNKKK